MRTDYSEKRIARFALIIVSLYVLVPVFAPMFLVIHNWGLDVILAMTFYYALVLISRVFTDKLPVCAYWIMTFLVGSFFEMLQFYHIKFLYHPIGTFDFPGDFIAYAFGATVMLVLEIRYLRA